MNWDMRFEEIRNEEQLNKFMGDKNCFNSFRPYYVAEVQACNQIYIAALEIEKENQPLAVAMMRQYFQVKQDLCEKFDCIVVPNIYKGLQQHNVKFII